MTHKVASLTAVGALMVAGLFRHCCVHCRGTRDFAWTNTRMCQLAHFTYAFHGPVTMRTSAIAAAARRKRGKSPACHVRLVQYSRLAKQQKRRASKMRGRKLGTSPMPGLAGHARRQGPGLVNRRSSSMRLLERTRSKGARIRKRLRVSASTHVSGIAATETRGYGAPVASCSRS